MMKFSEIKPGDIIMAEFEGRQSRGVVKGLNKEEKEVCVETDVQEFWFTPEHLYPIPLDENQLLRLGFQRQDTGDGTLKYTRDSFRVMVPAKGNFDEAEIWWREDKRHIHAPIYVHDLQNHFYQMTKVELNP